MGLYEDITRARDILGIPERASYSSILEKYRSELRRWHPDHCEGDKAACEEKTRNILFAGKILLKYCRDYPVPFTKEDITAHLPADEFWMKKFGNDPMWGNPDARR